MKDVSIVSGTYNRLPYMKRMVDSVRKSVGPISYEIILVDGGSKDGTIEWCKRQQDITIIEQGELYGAVTAFNEGARSAVGDYVILANDDIEFVDLSILRSFSFMESNNDVGIGCFQQDRGRQDWHVEHMPAVNVVGIIVSVPYGQVCIVPTWLGNEVGWWGDYLHTYGGDNELSCNIIERGYDVVPIECACIHDMRVDDVLRDINQGDPKSVKGKMHPDTALWVKKWTRRGKLGPRVPAMRSYITKENKHKRILYAPIYEPGHMLQRSTKVGLHKALEGIGLVHECDYINDGIDELLYTACAMCPDLFVIQIQDANTITPGIIREMRTDHPDAIFVSWNGDYHPSNLYDKNYIETLKNVDFAGFAVASVKVSYMDQGINWFYWQIGYEESSAKPNEATKHHDVVFLGNAYSETRKGLGRFLINLKARGVDVGLYGSWPEDWSMGNNLYDFDSGQRIYRASKIAISDQQWPDAIGYVSNRLFQSMAAGGCLVLQQYFDGMEEYLGLVDGKHLVIWRTLDELDEHIHNYLNDNTIRRRMIAKKGHEYMLDNHSFNNRVKELVDVLGW